MHHAREVVFEDVELGSPGAEIIIDELDEKHRFFIGRWLVIQDWTINPKMRDAYATTRLADGF
jgi:hypothetical protein